MPDRYLQLEDIRLLTTPERITDAFRKLGYNKVGECFDAEDLELSPRNIEAIDNAYLIADQDSGLQVILFELKEDEWETPSSASTRMKAIANQVVQRDTEFLLLATKDYNQLMLVNPRKTFDNENKRKVSIRKLLIDRTNPTAYDRDRIAIEALVQKCLDAKGQGVENWEAEIDDRVAHLYGLTAEDMKIIRGE